MNDIPNLPLNFTDKQLRDHYRRMYERYFVNADEPEHRVRKIVRDEIAKNLAPVVQR